jgi:nicotinamidase-related amidase
MLLERSNSALVLIDIQPRIVAATAHHAQTLANVQRLATASELLGVPACATEQNPTKLGHSEPSIAPFIHQVFHKMSFDATQSPAFLAWLESKLSLSPPPASHQDAKPSTQTTTQIVIAGYETHICLLQSALQLKKWGYEVYVVADACGSRVVSNHEAGLARAVSVGCHVVTTEMVLFEWLETAEHHHFKGVQSLIK